MVENLLLQVKDKVPEVGDFPVVYEEYKVEDKTVGASHILLKVSHVSIDKTGRDRIMDLAVLNYPSPYGAEMGIKYGTKEDIIRYLEDPSLAEELLNKIPRLIRDLEDV